MTTPTTAESTLVEIGELVRARPGVHAPQSEVAAWYERKAVLLHHIAAETGDAEADRLSCVAHDHALDLLGCDALIGGLPGQGKAGNTFRVGVAR